MSPKWRGWVLTPGRGLTPKFYGSCPSANPACNSQPAFFFFVVEYDIIQYNLSPKLGKFVCESFHDEIEDMYNVLQVPSKKTGWHEASAGAWAIIGVNCAWVLALLQIWCSHCCQSLWINSAIHSRWHGPTNVGQVLGNLCCHYLIFFNTVASSDHFCKRE